MNLSTSNPMTNSERIIKSSRENAVENAGVFSVRGACTKGGFMIALCFFSACLTYANQLGGVATIVALICSLIAYLAGIFIPSIAKICAPVYAICEGALLGGFSSYVDNRFGAGLSIYALLGTVSIGGIVFVGYISGIFKVNQKLINIAITLGLALMITYLANMLLPLFGGRAFTSIADTSLLGFGINLVALAVGAVYLLIDFDNVFELENNADSRYEWVWGMGFLASIVWVYIELLKLAVKIQVLLNGDD